MRWHSVLQVVIDQIWHSEIIIGSTSVDSIAWSQWPKGDSSSPLDMHLGLKMKEVGSPKVMGFPKQTPHQEIAKALLRDYENPLISLDKALLLGPANFLGPGSPVRFPW